MPDTLKAETKRRTGLVLKVGPGRYLDGGLFLPTTLRAGERVLLGAFGLVAIPDEDDIGFVAERDVVGVIRTPSA